MAITRPRTVVLACLVLLGLAVPARPGEEATLSREQIREFLLNAKVVASKPIGKGVTGAYRLTLSAGDLTHDAAFNFVDERAVMQRFATGTTELNFRDSYHFNIAAYELAVLLGLDHMMPVTVERNWNGRRGSLSWWIRWKWDEAMRRKENLQPPDPLGWNFQQYRMRAFSQLVYDTDRNLGNQLITEDWKLYMIDFTRAFRLHRDLKSTADLHRCDGELLRRLRDLREEDVRKAVRSHLTRGEVAALMARRDKLVAHFDALIAERGEHVVLY
jgi:hypothetical protein